MCSATLIETRRGWDHVCILDGFLLVACLGVAPSFVARREGLAGVPVYGTICRALQLIYVQRQDPASRRACADAIVQRVRAGAGWPPLVVFPEGGTSRRGLKEFRAGAFRAGAPVQPVALRYDAGLPADDRAGGGWLSELLFILGLMGRVSTVCEVCFLPTHEPSAAERAEPARFAAAVRGAIERTLGERGVTNPLRR